MTRWAWLSLVVAGVLLVPARSAWANPQVSFTMAGTAGANGWFRSNVTIHWTVTEPEKVISSSGCEVAELVTTEGQSDHTCTVTFSGGSSSGTASPKVDKTAPSVSAATPTRGPDSNGWYNHAVALAVTGSDATSGIASCSSPEYAGPDGAARDVAATCTDVAGNTSAPSVVTLKYDATAPSVTAAPEREPDANGWYNHAVAITAAATDPVSGVASCSAPSYSGPDNPAVAIDASCTDNAGNTSTPAATTLKYDATPPTISVAAGRPPNARGWYVRPLKVSFAGTDAISGLAACSPPVLYKGPDRAPVNLVGTCRDAAGNLAKATSSFKYDATKPKLRKLTAKGEKGLVRIGWRYSADAVSVELVRRPGVKGARRTIVYRGKGLTFADASVRNGVHYRYAIRVVDGAGNASATSVAASPRPPLYKPALGAIVRPPLTLAWEARKGARFYNVQLLRNGVKVLSKWPRVPTLRLRSSWRYAGKTYRLEPGRYRWYVWGARGTRERPNYGRPLGTSMFRVGSPPV